MKTKIILLIACCFSCNFIYAQCINWRWAKGMGGINDEIGYSIAVDVSGNVYTTGFFYGAADFDPGAGTFNLTAAGAKDIFITKLDASGNFAWARAIGGTGNEEGKSIAVDAAGNIYVTGYFSSIVDFDPGPATFNLTAAGIEDIFVCKLDGLGNLVWAKRMGGVYVDFSYSVALDAAGNVYTTGNFFGTGDFDPGPGVFNLNAQINCTGIFVSKLDSSGNFLWAKSMGGIGTDNSGTSIAIDNIVTGDVYITGYFTFTVDFDPGAGTFNLTSAGARDIFISRLDSSGDFVWAKAISGTGIELVRSIAIDGTGNILTTGVFVGPTDFDSGPGTYNLTTAGAGDIFISKLDGSGNFLWAKRIGSYASDDGFAAATDASGNIYIAGFFSATVDFDPGAGVFNLSAINGNKFFVLKLDAFGNFVWAKTSSGATDSEVAFGIAIDNSGNIFITGHLSSPTATFNTFTIANHSMAYLDVFVAKLGTDIITDASIVSSQTGGCLPNTIYVGYGSQSITLTASATGAVAYLWSTGETTQIISVSTAGTYSVSVYDANGCASVETPETQIVINVVDARCGNNKTKITMCHVPDGNPANRQTICIAPTAVAAHLALHAGDCIGECSSSQREIISGENENFYAYSYPNPFSSGFNLTILTASSNSVIVNIHNMLGQVIETYSDVTEQTVIGTKLNAGIYFAEVIQDDNRQMIQIVKSE